MDLTRREFMGMTGGALFAGAVNANAAAGFELIVLATNWGFQGSWNEFARKTKTAGYDGVEVWYPSDAADRDQFEKAVSGEGLRYGFLVGGSDRDFNTHFSQFRTSLEAAVKMKPLYINCHSGRDHFSFEQNKQFIDLTNDVSAKSGVPIYHETHRSRILYSAPVCRQFMEKTPVRLTLDISHWCNVHESLLEDQTETVTMALSRTDHIHARIGHQEGPQVNDPRAPEWKKALDAHLAWWDEVVKRKKSEGKRLTFLTEFGPVDYMPAIPYTRQPVSNQWEINVHMMDLIRKRYA